MSKPYTGKKEIPEGIKFWHKVKLSDGSYTPGIVNHGDDPSEFLTTRFGIPLDLKGQKVLGIGSWDGQAEFECERRGAASVTASDVPATMGGQPFGGEAFQFIKEDLKSKVVMEIADGQRLWFESNEYDLVMCFGVLYHVDSPMAVIKEAIRVCKPGGLVLFETAICDEEPPILYYRPGYNDDPTNKFYPTMSFLFKAVEPHKVFIQYHDGVRATIGVIKDGRN